MMSTLFFLFSTIFLLYCTKAKATETEELANYLNSKEQSVRISAVEQLGRMKDKNAAEILLRVVFRSTEDWKVKIKAIRALGEFEDPQISDRLVTLFNNPFLNEECPAVKWNTAIALGNRSNRGSRAVDSLINALNHENLIIREAAIQSLGRIGDARAVPYLITALKDDSFAIKASAIEALEKIGDPEAIPFLKQIMEGENEMLLKKKAEAALRFLEYKKHPTDT